MTPNNFPAHYKLSVMCAVQTSEKSKKEIAKHYNVHPTTINNWLRSYNSAEDILSLISEYFGETQDETRMLKRKTEQLEEENDNLKERIRLMKSTINTYFHDIE